MDNQPQSTLAKIRQERIEKVNKLRSMGIDPYPAQAHKELANKDIINDFDKYNGKATKVTGRLMSWREHGQLVFADLEDESGKIQLYIKQEELANREDQGNLGFEDLGLVDVGDIVEAEGQITKTIRGEISILVKKLRILSKSLRPLPEKWKGIVDPETRFRRRYLDMTMNQEVRQRFIRRAQFWQAIRSFMIEHGFHETNIPVLEHLTGGADAVPFETHMNALDQKFFLRISHELPLKRLLGGGLEKVFDIGPRFRNEGLSDEHLPEHIAMEFYWAYADFNMGLKFTEELFKSTLSKVYGTLKFNIKGFEVDLGKEWEILDYASIIKEKLGLDINTSTDEDFLQVLKDHKVNLPGEINRNRLIDNAWKIIRKTIAGPAFLVNVPKFMSPLAKSVPGRPELTQRLQPVIAGSELANAYGELNDPQDQLARFMEQQALRDSGDEEAQMLDIDYVEMLEYGMPPAFGFGLSERVFWFFENVSAKEGVPFPPMRYELEPITKQIYNLDSTDKATQALEIDTTVYEQSYPTTAETEKLLEENVKDAYQIIHARMVGLLMQDYADTLALKYTSESKSNPAAFDSTRWHICGLVHDWDYGFDPAGHPENNTDKLKALGYPDDIIMAILGHKPSLNIPRSTRMAQALLSIDELAGLLFAYAKIKGGFDAIDVAGIAKKFKDKAFAAKINRADIELGVSELGLTLPEHFANILEIMDKKGLRLIFNNLMGSLQKA